MAIRKQKSLKDANRNSGIESSVTAVKRQEEDLMGDRRHRRNAHTPHVQAKIIQTDEEKLRLRETAGHQALHQHTDVESVNLFPVSVSHGARSISLCRRGSPTGVRPLSWPITSRVDSWTVKQACKMKRGCRCKDKGPGYGDTLGRNGSLQPQVCLHHCGHIRREVCKLRAEDVKVQEQSMAQCGSWKWESRWTNGFQIEYAIAPCIRVNKPSVLTSG